MQQRGMHHRHLTGIASCALLLAACAHGRAHAVVGAGPAARSLGVTGYRVLHDDPADLDVELVGERSGRLHAHGTPDRVEQRLDGAPQGPVEMAASAQEVSLRTDGAIMTVALRSGGRWRRGAGLTAAQTSALRMLMAVDVDLAVQGSSLILGGADYVQCTFACSAASSCTPAWNEQGEACARSVADCSSCMAAQR
jgi:hypothetical protein